MNYLLKTTVLAAAMTATSLACLPAANAQDFTVYPSYNLYRLPNGSLAVNPAAVAALAPAAPPAAYGITAPAAAVGAATYGITAPGVAAGTYGITAPDYATGTFGVTNFSSQSFISPVYAGRVGVALVAPQPWSAQWLAYCQTRYRTFNASTGTFIGYDGMQHFCGG